MLENLYTTKMTTSKRILQNRFKKIRSEKGEFSKIITIICSVIFLSFAIFANVCAASLDISGLEESKVRIFLNNEEMLFDSEPFFYENTVYLPLRELSEKFGIFENGKNKIVWGSGRINIFIDGQRTLC